MTTDLNITARQVRGGDAFVLHGHERVADGPAWPLRNGHVHIRFVGGGDAVIAADGPPDGHPHREGGMTYRVTLESGATGVVDEVARRRLLRQAERQGWPRTRVRGGDVVTLPRGLLVAILVKAP